MLRVRLFENRYPIKSVKNSKETFAMKCNFKAAANLLISKSYFTDVSMEVLWNFKDEWTEAGVGVLQIVLFKNFVKFTGKHLYQNFFLINFRPAACNLIKK